METSKLIPSYPITVYTDGGARGNPGPAAIGIFMQEPGMLAPRRYTEYIGETTNNVAEYRAVIFALQKARQLLGKIKARRTALEIKTDSELLYYQMRGEYKIKEPHLQPLFIELWNLKQDFQSVTFTIIPREQNKEADALVNQTLNKQ